MWVLLLLLVVFLAFQSEAKPIQNNPEVRQANLKIPEIAVAIPEIATAIPEAPARVEDPVLARVRRLGIAPGQGRRADLGM